MIEQLAAAGIGRERLLFHGRCSTAEYLSLHHRVDICLDTQPYAGGTVTMHALWMGVPTLTLAGSTSFARAGAGIMGQLGLQQFIAADAADFVEKGLYWSTHPAALAALRAGLRARLQLAPSGRPDLIAAHLEAALRRMWRRWCDGLPAESFDSADPGPGQITPSYSPASESPAIGSLSHADSSALDDACDKAMSLQLAGQTDQAAQLYRTILQAEPAHGAANHCFGMLHV